VTVEPDPADLTARARIRDAALRLFGERGFERTTIREIAAAAGVSSGLARHHFGSKEALRAACDAYLITTFRRLTEQALADTAAGRTGYLGATSTATLPYRRYVARALAEGGAAPLFDELVAMTKHWLAERDGAVVVEARIGDRVVPLPEHAPEAWTARD